MKVMRWLCVLGLLWAVPTLAVENLQHDFVVGADVNAKGEVTAVQPASDISKPISQMLDVALRHWHFVPAQRDGKALPVHTFIKARVEALPGNHGNGSVRVSYLRHGPRWADSEPIYPADSVRMRETGVVALTGVFQADGKVANIQTYSWTSYSNGHRSSLARTAYEWFAHATFTLETLDGQPVTAQIRHYLRFELHDEGASKNEPDPPLNPQEWRVLKQAGFKDADDGKDPQAPETSSVLLAADVHPVIIQF